jgi:hypothetical protein
MARGGRYSFALHQITFEAFALRQITGRSQRTHCDPMPRTARPERSSLLSLIVQSQCRNSEPPTINVMHGPDYR